MLTKIRMWLGNEGAAAAKVGAALGFCLGLGDAIHVIRGQATHDPWLGGRSLTVVYPVAGAAWWALLFLLLAAAIAAWRRLVGGPRRRAVACPAWVLYAALAVGGGLVMSLLDKFRAIAAPLLSLLPPGLSGMVLLGAAGVGGASLLVLHLRPLPPDRIRNRGSRLVSLAAWLAVAALAVIAAKTVSFGGAEARLSEVSAGKPNILLISIDALRADAVGCLSETAPPTPEMDKLAGRGVAFSAAFAQSPWTFPSFASLMTSTFPSEAGINLFGEGEIDFPGMNLSLGGSSVPMLAELLKKGGYQTSAQVTNPVLFPARHCGWDRGFDSYRHCDEPIRMLPFHALVTHLVPRLRPRYRSDDAEAVTRGAVAWLRKNARQPFFLWVHYLDPHHPYCPPGCAAASDPDWAIAWRASADSIRLGMQCKSLAAREKLRILYDAEVTYVDHWVGELLAAVDDLGCKERTLVVLTADHGEEFWEHGGWEHGHCLHDEVIRVPLLVAFPDGRHAGETVGRPVALLDVMPTVLEVAGLDLPRHIRGLSLLGLLDGRSGAVAADRAMFAEGLAFGPELKGIRAGEWLVTFRPEDGSFEEFREGAITSGSPGKSSARVDPGALRERLKSWAAEMRRAAASRRGRMQLPKLTPHQKEALEALGYL